VPSSTVPKAGCETLSPQFVDLAKSTEIEIAFDKRWLHPNQVTSFLSIVSQPERFRGFPVDEKNLKGRRLEDWTVFSPVDEPVVLSNEPPSYTEVMGKRLRESE
jgi:hypothetical protein